MGLTDAYTAGLLHTLYALAWVTGVLTILTGVAALAGVVYLAARPTVPVVRRRLISRRLHAQARRSGRS